MVRKFKGRNQPRRGKVFKAVEIKSIVSAEYSRQLEALNLPADVKNYFVDVLCRRLAKKSRLNPGKKVSDILNIFEIIRSGIPQKEKGIIKATLFSDGRVQIVRIEK